MMSNVQLRRVHKRFGGSTVVRDVDLDIADGELMVIVGPSGCGKTTVLRMVAGLESISGGDILVDGHSIGGVHVRDRDLAMVSQESTLYPHLTVAGNLGFPLKMAGVGRAEVTQRVDLVADMIGLRDVLPRLPGRLSGGQRQRAAMGRALIRHPQLLLMDEPMSNLDAKLRTELRASIGHLQQRLGVTTLYVTHDQVEAMALGHRIALMRDGCVVQCGSPEDLYHRPVDAFVGSFIGSPPMNLMLGTLDCGPDGPRVLVDESSLILPADDRRHLAPHDGREVVVGIRAQALRFTDGPGLEVDVDTVDQSSGRCVINATVRASAVVVTVGGVRVEQRPARLVLEFDGDDGLDEKLWRRSTLIADAVDIHLFDPTSGRSLLLGVDEPVRQTMTAAT